MITQSATNRLFPQFEKRSRVHSSRLVARWFHPGQAAALLIAFSTAWSLAYIWWLCPMTLAPDEAHYWEWSEQLDWSYYSKGPLVAWLMRASCELFGDLSLRLTGDLAAAVRTPAAVCHAAILISWYLLASGIYRSQMVGFLIVLVGITLPVVRAGAVLMTIDPPFLACWSWALVCVWQAFQRGKTGWWIGAGILTALGTLAKFTMVLLPAAVVGFILWHRRSEFRRSGILILLAGAILGWVPILYWNAHHDWVSFRHVFGQVGGSSQHAHQTASWWLGPVMFLGSQFGMMFGLWLLAFWVACWRYRPTYERDEAIRLMWWCAFPVWFFFLVASCIKPGQPNWPAPAYVSGLVLTIGWVREFYLERYSRTFLSTVLIALFSGLLASAIVHFPAVVRPLLASIVPSPTRNNPLPVRQLDMTARLTGWKQLAAAVDEIRYREKQRTGLEPILAGTHWTIPGELRIYCAGHPRAYAIGIPNQSDRHSQYDLWRPNPVRDAQAFQGRTFLIVGDIAPHMLTAFATVEQPIMVTHEDNGIPLASWSIWVCHGFRGFNRDDGRHQAGY